jgi:hypothetical protein
MQNNQNTRNARGLRVYEKPSFVRSRVTLQTVTAQVATSATTTTLVP